MNDHIQTDQLQLVMIQANPITGAISENLAKIITYRRQHQSADLLIFSECFLTGYPLQDLVGVPHFIARTGMAITELASVIKAEPGPAVLFGTPTVGADKPYNTAVLIRADGTLAMTHKQELPNNDVFDEQRTFARAEGKALPLRLNEHWSLGVLICEDGWHKKVAGELAGEGADMLISINGSPCRLDKHARRLEQMRRRVAETCLPLVYVNQVGGQDELVFDGTSFALATDCSLVRRLAFMQTDTASLTAIRDARGSVQLEVETSSATLPLAPEPNEIELMYRAGVLGLRDYADKNNIPAVHIGISGGADSALVAAIAADALGPDRVRGYRLPSDLTGSESMDLATELMNRLGCSLETVRIAGIATEVQQATDHIGAQNEASAALARENLQARLRMVTLMQAANALGGMLLGTSNKSESSVGYTTIYGDMAGLYNPIKDLYKTDVWDVMRWRNGTIPADSLNPVANPIPEAIIIRPPTAELAEAQTDEASLGSYHILDPLLKGIIEQQLDPETARLQTERQVAASIPAAYAARIGKLVYQAEFKRRQACIGPQIRPNSFGLARRYPITNLFGTQPDSFRKVTHDTTQR